MIQVTTLAQIPKY